MQIVHRIIGNLDRHRTTLGTTEKENYLAMQILDGDAAVHLKFIAKGDSNPTDSPGELYITVRFFSWHATFCLLA